MSGPTCEVEGASIVLIGAFNPGIFQPSWFGSHDLLRPEEVDAATNANNLVVAREIAAFTAGWVDLQVTEQRFSAQTSDPAQYVTLRDLVISVFRLLEHTPFTQLGINCLMHFSMPSADEWNSFGDFLAPKKAWRGLVVQPGLLSLKIVGPKPDAEHVGYTTKVEPSTRVNPGVYIETNEHYGKDGSLKAKDLLKALEESWEGSLVFAKRVADRLFDEFYAGRR